MTFKQYRVPLPFHERYFSQMNMCIIFSVILMPKTEKHLCRHRITKFATSVFCFKSNRTKVNYKRPEIKKEMMSLILINCFFQLTPCPSF